MASTGVDESVVSVDCLHSNLRKPDLKVLDASRHGTCLMSRGIRSKNITMFRVLGHEKVWVLDGGLPRWRAPGDAILKASAASEAIEKIYQGHSVSPVTFKTKFQPHLVWTLEQLKKRFEQEGKTILYQIEEPPLDKPVMASCGTGVTACILALGLHRLGETEVPVYDGMGNRTRLTHGR
uniref:Rhodanese domain-containing protein n=1 Tax=Brassica campestris TaxID=3711 RepID=M4CW06_BRACM